MKVLILAGGFATRLWPLTENRAKPLLLLDGKTILHHVLDQVLADRDDGKIKEEDVIVLTNTKFEQDFRKELDSIGFTDVQIFLEDAKSDGEKMGALGAVWACIEEYELRESLCILAGDNLIPNFSIDQIICSDNEARLLVKDIGDRFEARKFGVVELENSDKNELQRVVRFEEKPNEPNSTMVSTGFVGLGIDCFPVLEAYIQHTPDDLGGVFVALLESDREIQVLASEVDGIWFDVGSFETYMEAHKLLHGSDKSIPSDHISNSTFSGACFVGEGAMLENCVVIDSIIYPGARLKDCRISNCAIDSNCDLEGLDLCWKIVRQGTVLRVGKSVS